MPDIITPDIADYRWGPEPYALLDYYRHPTRDGVDAAHPNGQNPCLFYRHGGGGTTGDYSGPRDNMLGAFVYDSFYFIPWLCDHAEGGTGTQGSVGSGTHWDVCSFDSAQMFHFDFDTSLHTTLFQRSRNVFFPDAIRDCQRAIATIKSLAVILGFNPDKIISHGESYGATMTALAQLLPQIGGSGNRSVYRPAARRILTHDSTVRGTVQSQAQVDCRRFAGVDYMSYDNFTGWFGTSPSDGGIEFDAVSQDVKAAVSLRAYFDAGDLDSYVGCFVGNVTQGNHVHPYANAHDSQQGADLIAAMQAAGLTEGTGRTSYGQQLRAPGAWDNSVASGGNWPNGPTGSVLASMQTVETWMAAQIA